MTFTTEQLVWIFFAYNVIGFGLRTFPMPVNVYGRWFLGLLQFAFMNFGEAIKNVTNGKIDLTGTKKDE